MAVTSPLLVATGPEKGIWGDVPSSWRNHLFRGSSLFFANWFYLPLRTIYVGEVFVWDSIDRSDGHLSAPPSHCASEGGGAAALQWPQAVLWPPASLLSENQKLSVRYCLPASLAHNVCIPPLALLRPSFSDVGPCPPRLPGHALCLLTVPQPHPSASGTPPQASAFSSSPTPTSSVCRREQIVCVHVCF